MKSLTILLLLAVSIFSLTGAILVNPDKPLKGKWEFNPQKVLEISTFKDDPFGMVQRFAISEDEKIIIFDRRQFKFFTFDSNGQPLHKFGTRGEGPGEIKYMLDYYLVSDKIIVYDLGRINYLDQEGQFLRSELTNSTIGIAPFFFLDDNRYLKSRQNLSAGGRPESLEIYDLKTKKSTYLAGDAPKPVKGSHGGVSIMISIGTSGAARNPGYVVGRVGNQLFWGFSDVYQIQSCDFNGKENFTFSVEERERKKISYDYKKRLVSRMRFMSNHGEDEEAKKRYLKRIPDQCTYFSRITSDKHGLIYVIVSDVERENARVIDIFSPRGKYLYRAEISVPEGHRIIANGMVFKGDFVYMVLQDPDGEASLNKYKITLPDL